MINMKVGEPISTKAILNDLIVQVNFSKIKSQVIFSKLSWTMLLILRINYKANFLTSISWESQEKDSLMTDDPNWYF